MHWIISDWPKHLTVKRTLYVLNTYPQSPDFHPFELSPQPAVFEIQACRKSEMYWMTPDWPWPLTVKKVPCIHWILTSEAEICIRFTLQPSVLKIQGCRKSDTHRMTSDWPWTLNCQKHPVYTEYLPPETQIFIGFTLRPAFFEIQGCEKSEMHWMTLNCQNNDLYTGYLLQRPKLSSVSLYDRLQDRMLLKTAMHRMTPDWPWRSVKGTLKTPNA